MGNTAFSTIDGGVASTSTPTSGMLTYSIIENSSGQAVNASLVDILNTDPTLKFSIDIE